MRKILLLKLLFLLSLSLNAQIVDIPDSSFKAELVAINVINTNGDDEIQVSEALSYNGGIRLDDSTITSLVGLEAFTNLSSLTLVFLQQLENLDISQNTNLTNLDINSSSIGNIIDISNNTKLETIRIVSNNLSSIDLSKNIALIDLNLSANELTTIDISNNLNLIDLDLRSNQLIDLDLSVHNKLETIICNNNILQSLNIANGNNTIIQDLDVSTNFLACIQVDNVEYAEANTDWIKDEYPSYSAFCTGNEGQEIVDIPNLEFKNYLLDNADHTVDINVNGDDEIQAFEAHNYSGAIYLNSFWLDPAAIDDLTGIESFTALNQLYIRNTNIDTINLSTNLKLTAFESRGNNNIISINISHIPNLRYFISESNDSLESLNIANQNNTNFSYLLVNDNDNLFCMTVDDVDYSIENFSNVNNQVSFSTDCSLIRKLNITSENGSIITSPESDDGFYNIDSEITLTPTPNEGYQFDGWTGDIISSETPLTFNIENNTEIEANFSLIQFNLTTQATNGTITSNPIADNNLYDKNTEVTLTATPDEGYQFDGWSGDAAGTMNPITITIDEDKTVTALFSRTQHTIDITAENGIVSVDTNPTNGTYDYGTEVTLTATPNQGYQFDGWEGYTETASSLTITIDQDKNVTALFSKIQNTLDITAENGTVSVDTEPTNGTYDYGTEVTLTATPEEGYQFDGWDGYTETTSSLTITVDEDKTVTALFSKIQHTLDITAENGTVSVDTEPTNGTYDYGTEVTLTATPDEGYQFDGWSGDAAGTMNPITITVDEDKTVTALFSKTQHTLDITAENGTVSVDTEPTNGTYDYGTEVTLTATPDEGYQFDGWSSDATGTMNPLNITVDEDKTVTALFSKTQHTLDITAENGTVSVDTEPTNGTYDYGTEVTLTATPDEGYQFDGWSSDAAGTMNPLTITVDEDKTVTALFSKTQHTLDITAENGTVSVDAEPTNGTYDYGTEVTLTVTPDEGYQFDGWSSDAAGTMNPLTITVDEDKSVTALFSKIQHTLAIEATNGTVTLNPEPINGTYDYGTEVTITTIPNSNNVFVEWLGDITGNETPLTITMDDDKTIEAIFSATASINDNTFNKKINVYPNPAKEFINIEILNNITVKSVMIIDMAGKEIIRSIDTEINVSQLVNGVYFLRIIGSNNKTATIKFIKE